MWRRRRSRLLFRSQSGCCSCEHPARRSSPSLAARRPPASRRGGLSPTSTPTLTPTSRPAALVAVFPFLHMASSVQSGGSSGGPAVPTVQRGIVKMVRTGPRIPTLPPASGRESGAGFFSPPASLHSLPDPLHFSPILRIPSLKGIRHGLPLVFCLWDTPASGVTVISVVAALRSFGCSPGQTDYRLINGDNSSISVLFSSLPVLLSILTFVEQFAIFRDPDIRSFWEYLAILKLFYFHRRSVTSSFLSVRPSFPVFSSPPLCQVCSPESSSCLFSPLLLTLKMLGKNLSDHDSSPHPLQ